MKMANLFCDFRFLLLIGAAAFVFIQIRLFATQSEYVDRIAAAVESESHCTSQMRLLIDQISMQQERVVALEDFVVCVGGWFFVLRFASQWYRFLRQKVGRCEEKARLDQECSHLKELVENLKRKGSQKLTSNLQEPLAAVVVMACNRADYLDRTIKSILKYQRSVASKFPLFISQDGTNSGVKSKALSYNETTYMQHLDNNLVETERPGEMIAYYRIADHYKWALDELFYNRKFNRVIILEDDMEIAPDFFDYFEAMAALLDKDKTIMAVSSWNDNGQRQFVHDPHVLYRSDFFPGLGWMLTRSTWNELSPKWPKAYWDDWLRLKVNRKDRHFIRPEVCRTYNFGEHGSSMGQFFKQYLEPIKMNDLQVDWKSMDLSYLMEDKYREHLSDIIRKAKPIDGMGGALKAASVNGDVRINYKNQADFESIARQFGVFEEWKDGVPRTAYKGVVIFRYQPPRRVLLIGPDSLKQLGIEDA